MQQQKNMFVLETKPTEFQERLDKLRKQLTDHRDKKNLEDFVEISIDLQSYLPKWNLQNPKNKQVISDQEICEEIKKNYSLLKKLGYKKEIDLIKQEAKKINSYNICELALESDNEIINNRLGNNDGTGLKKAMRQGAVLVTTNPQIVNVLRKRFPDYWDSKKQEIKKRNPDFKLEQLAARITTEAVLESARLLRPIYENGDIHMGYVSFQLNPNLSKDSEAMIKDAKMVWEWLKQDFNGEDPNVVFKVPGTYAGLDTARDLTNKGIGVNITVNYSVAQQIAFADIIEKGKAKHCYLTQMNRRLESPVAEEIGEVECNNPEKISSWSSSAVIRKTYDLLYNQKRYDKSVLLSASINQPWHVSRSITNGNGHPLHMTITPEGIDEFDSGLGKLYPCIFEEIGEDIIRKLSKSETFRKSYYPEELKPKDFDNFKPTLKTLDGFKQNYNEFLQWCNE